MRAMASQVTSLTIISSVYSGADHRKLQSSASLAFVRGIQRWSEFPSQKANDVENVAIITSLCGSTSAQYWYNGQTLIWHFAATC